MKDYSKFIQSSYGFITKYEVVGNQIYVYTAENEKDMPHVYPATKENLAYIDNRLGNQYKLIVNNKGIIVEEFSKKVGKKIKTIGNIIAGALVLSGIILASTLGGYLYLILGLLLGGCSVTGSLLVAEGLEKKFNEELNMYHVYLDNRKKIAQKCDEDSNVIRNLSFNASNLIEKKECQKDTGLIENAFDIDLMDKLQLKDLRKLLINYRICLDIKSKQSFTVPEECKKKVKKKKNEE